VSAALINARLSPDQTARLRRLTQAPPYAWPTLAVFALAAGTAIAVDVLALRGLIPLWAGFLLNSAAGYWGFSVRHDAIHRAISKRSWINDLVGQFDLLCYGPTVPLSLFRWGHIQHHRYTSGPKDPDLAMHGTAWSLPLRWMLVDVWYLAYLLRAIRAGDRTARGFVRPTLLALGLSAAVVALALATGHGLALLLLWLLPTRIAGLLLGFTFFWLPHVPHDVSQEQNFFRATTVRLGLEWVMTPLLQYQNYHLLHHLYPSTPFYNNGRLWRLLEPELRRHELAIQHGLAIRPTIYPGSVGAAP
jgi:beta-carotene hydroxylase